MFLKRGKSKLTGLITPPLTSLYVTIVLLIQMLYISSAAGETLLQCATESIPFQQYSDIATNENSLIDDSSHCYGINMKMPLRAFLKDVAVLTLRNGDYQTWTKDQKECLLQSMTKNGLLSKESATIISGYEEKIDAYILKRYAPPSYPNDLQTISLMRIADVEAGPYFEWSNETWAWFTQMMYEVGLWSNANDIDVYVMPDDDAITPGAAIEQAKQKLVREGISLEKLEHATVFWHYLTHASDFERTDLKYLITFRMSDNTEYYVWLTPDGELL